jgi:cytochrome P450
MFGPDVAADPYPAYRALREAGPLVTVNGRRYVTTYELADQVLKESRLGRGAYTDIMQSALGAGPLFDSLTRWILYLDPPDHTRIRSLVLRAFTPRAINRLHDKIQLIVDQLLDDLIDAGTADFLTTFAYPLPVHVICEMLGVPAVDRDDFKTWSAHLGRGLDISAATPEIIARGNVAADRLNEYFRGIIAERRKVPQNGFLDDLIAAEADGGGRLTDDELLATLVLIFFAGHETTVNLLGNGTYALLRERGEWEELCADQTLAAAAVEEMLRYDTPVQRANRVALEDVDLNGQHIETGEMIYVLIGGANRDPARFADPDRFTLTRAEGGRGHLSFSAGPHYCLGATLARVEAQIAMASLARRVPNLELASDDVRFRAHLVLRGLEELPVRAR